MAYNMMPVTIVFGLLAAQAAALSADLSGSARARQQSLERAWSHDLSSSVTGVSPIKRVVNLLSKMKAELEKEAANESEMYDKMVCWCETNEKEKTKAVADAEAKDKDLMAEIEERSASVGELVATIDMLKKQIAEDTASLKKATAIREKAAAEFLETEKDLVQTITNLGNAVGVLAKHHEGSFLQMNGPLVSGLRVLLRSAAMKYEMLHGETGVGLRQYQTVFLQSETKQTSSAEQALLSALDVHGESVPDSLPLKFAQRLVAKSAAGAPRQAGSFLQAAPSAGSYNAASGGIYGIMTQMLEEFKAQLSTAQKDEKKAAEDFAGLEEAKSEQIAVTKEKLDDMESGSSENLKALADAKEDLAMTRKQRTMDVKFLRNLQDQCNDLDKQWERRSATRAAEIEAVSETLAILTEDEARDLMAKSVTLLQKRMGTVATAASRRYRAATFLRRAAQVPDFEADDLLAAWRGRHLATTSGVAGGPRAQLSTLVMSIQLDSFAKIKALMDKMVAELKNQQQEEVEFKAYCTKEFDKTEKAVYEKKQEKKDLEAKIEKLDILMKKLAKDIKKAKKQIAESSDEIKKASKSREAENAEFQTVVADQRATQVILKKALSRLEDFYKKGKGNKLVLAEQEPPVKFNSYKKNAGASPVMGLIEQIIEDSEKLVAEATEAEYKAQGEYEKFVTDSNAIINELSKDVEVKTKATATAKGETAEAKGDHENAVGELESLAEYDADLHGECDFVLKNFDIRQKARLQEMEAIQAAKGILSGAK